MIPKECKRLAEVDFPIAVVSKHSAHEKSIRHGHPSTLHLWWARRPLAACRAMLMALLLPDPCDDNCPKEFIFAAREILLKKQGHPKRWESEIKTNEGLRKILLEFIGDFANWDNSANVDYLKTARALVKSAHLEETPLVVDPFAGGGSIPLEALRLGCDTFASDLNPVACLILKSMLEDIPRHGPELAEELRRIGDEIKKHAEEELKEFYPDDPNGSKPIAYLWARTVKCESPNCGAEIPLMRSFWLCKKASRKRALHHKIIRQYNGPPQVEFEMFEPNVDKDVHVGTVSSAKATCLCCNTVLPPERVRAQLTEQRGGADVVFNEKGERVGGARMLAVVSIQDDLQGRQYRIPIEEDYQAIYKSKIRVAEILAEWERDGKKDICPVPDEYLPPKNTNCFRIPNYGVRQWKDITTIRQQLALSTLSKNLVKQGKENSELKSVISLLSLAVSRCSDFNSSLNSWATGGEFVRSTFARQALSMVWDFCETMPLTTESGGFSGAIAWIDRVTRRLLSLSGCKGQVEQADACECPLPDETVSIWFTDPPYYNAVGYAELSDFFFVWLKRGLRGSHVLRDPYDPNNPLVPKTRECVQDENYNSVNGKPKNRNFFEDTMGCVFGEGRRVIREDGLGSVVFAHKTTEGWEALLSGMTHGGWTITGSWPIATERPGRLRSQESAALATSVHLICRPRPVNVPVGDWAVVLQELPKRVGNWMERLQSEGVRGADLVFACIGPALEIYSRYSKVETADGKEVKLAEYLEKVWEVVGRMALEQVLGTEEAKARNGMALSAGSGTAQAGGALEEDARLTALFLWTLQSTNGNGEGKSKKEKGKSEELEDEESEEIDDDEDAAPKGKVKGFSLVFDVVRRFAQPLGIDLPKWEGRVIETKKGVVRLMAVSERAKQLFGEGGTDAAEWITEDETKSAQLRLFPEIKTEHTPKIHGRKQRKIDIDITAEDATQIGATTLDRVHAAMLLQAGGKANALRELIKSEQDRGSDFLRLANALSALYPPGSEEKRLLDAMLLAVPR